MLPLIENYNFVYCISGFLGGKIAPKNNVGLFQNYAFLDNKKNAKKSIQGKKNKLIYMHIQQFFSIICKKKKSDTCFINIFFGGEARAGCGGLAPLFTASENKKNGISPPPSTSPSRFKTWKNNSFLYTK